MRGFYQVATRDAGGILHLVFRLNRWYKFVSQYNEYMTNQRSAPVYLNLFRIHFPVGAVTSIAHRISGVLLFLSVPFFVYLLDLSLRGPEGFAVAAEWLDCVLVQIGSVMIAWSLFHHLFSGIRFLFIDIEKGVLLPQARISAWLVNIAGIVCTLLYIWWLLT